MRPEAALLIIGDPKKVKMCYWCTFSHRDPEPILAHQREKHGVSGSRPRLWRGWWRSPIYADMGEP